MRVAVYARYSSDNQRDASIVDQVRRCRQVIEESGGALDETLIFKDEATSGASLNRPGFEQMMKLVRSTPRGIDVIVTEDQSRISRDLADSTTFFRELTYLGVPLVAIADGIDTSVRGAKMHFTMKSLMSDMFLEDLRDKTRRGLEGRALAGFSTGGLPTGYKSEPELSPDGRVVGHRVLIDDERARVVQRVFTMYLDQMSLESIARQLNADGVAPARRGRYKHKGWTAETVRAMLRNRAYIGEWSYGRREWVKVPGTNTRRYRDAPANRLISKVFPDRRIIDDETWRAVNARLSEVRAFYTGKKSTSVRVSSGKRATFPLSGVLCCGVCGGGMIIAGQSTRAYYRCTNNKKRGTCKNASSLREDVARTRILDAITQRYASPAAIAYMRKRLAQRLGELSRSVESEITEVEQRRARTEERIRRLIEFVADGGGSVTVRATITDLEAQRDADVRTIDTLRQRASTPISLPRIDALLAGASNLGILIEKHPTRGRDALRRLFDNGTVTVTPDEHGIYTAKSIFFPLGMLALTEENAKTRHLEEAPGSLPDPQRSSPSCAGRI